MAFYKHKSPTFNINGINGWHNRQLYYYYGNDTLLTYTSGNIFAVITTEYNGSYSFTNFFNTGTVLKIKGRLYITTVGTDGTFNMRIYINNGTTTATLASQNGTANHSLTTVVARMPVDFEIEVNSKVNDTDDVYMRANGKYVYEADSFYTGGDNKSVSYVPMYSRDNYILSGASNDPFTLGIDFNGTDKINTIEICYVSIEQIQ
jgi:hypothetical protein